MRLLSDCRIVAQTEVAPGHFRMQFDAAEMARAAVPGQFCMVQVAEGLYPFLRRPMCFERFYYDGFSILFKVEGEGTRLMSRMGVGQTVSVQGPLGNGFPIDANVERHIIVAGGIGVAPFPGLAEALCSACDAAPEVVLAARTRDLLLCEADFRAHGCDVHLATDDGSVGRKGFASDVLEELSPSAQCCIYACGPMPMMRAVAKVAEANDATCWTSLEAQMACGDGICLGCVVESTDEREGEHMVRVCRDGPVLDARVIDWDAVDVARAP